MYRIKLHDKLTKNKDKNITLKIIQKYDLVYIKTPPVQDFQYSSPVLFHRIMCPKLYQIEFTESKIEKSDSPIWSYTKNYVGQTLRYTSNLARVVDGGATLIIHKNISED